MSFLMPLYLAAAGAVALPILFHLIRRTPRGQVPFSTLMFLQPSPPRLTRRSRLDHWLLLLLRGAVLLLLALAFARPLLRRLNALDRIQPQGRQMVLLLDTSASMQRTGLWQAVCEKASQLVADSDIADQWSVMTFDRDTRVLIPFAESRKLDRPQLQQLLAERLRQVAPTWHVTHLDQALIDAAELMKTVEDADHPSGLPLRRQIIAITDFQRGSRLDTLPAYHWPANTRLDLQVVAPTQAGNASLQLLEPSTAADGPDTPRHDRRLRVRIRNQIDSTVAAFTLRWQSDPAGSAGTAPSKATAPSAGRYHVPPGESRVVQVSLSPVAGAADRLVLSGDRTMFDNRWFVAVPARRTVNIAYLGTDAADDPQGLRFYLDRLFPTSNRVGFEVRPLAVEDPAVLAEVASCPLAVVTTAPTAGQLAALTRYAESGGTVLLVPSGSTDKPGAAPPMQAVLRTLLGLPQLTLSEAKSSPDYQMLGAIDFQHPLFVPFAEPRYSDFTQIRFWKYRRLTVNGNAPVQAIASFENGDPFLIHHRVEQGHVYIMTSSWRPSDSQLALSSKYPPLLLAMASRYLRNDDSLNSYTVGQPVPLPPVPGNLERSWTTPAGVTHSVNAGATRIAHTDQPGIYMLSQATETEKFAVNIDPRESLTAVADRDELEKLGVTLGLQPTGKQVTAQLRIKRDVELESRQQLWRWLLVTALAILLLEILLAGKAVRRSSPPTETA